MRVVLLLAAIFVLPPFASAQSVLYVAAGAGSSGQLYQVDPVNAQTTFVADIVITATGQRPAITALAFHPQSGVLYGVTGNEITPYRQLLTIDPLTGSASVIGTIGTVRFENTSDIAFAANGALYGWTVRGGPLVSLDRSTAGRTVIGSALNGDEGNGLTFAPDGSLYVVGFIGDGLQRADLNTGALTFVTALSGVGGGMVVNAMASDANGILFATSGSSLLRIDPATGIVTTVGTLPFSADAIAFAVPEPSTVALLVLGAVMLAIGRRVGRFGR